MVNRRGGIISGSIRWKGSNVARIIPLGILQTKLSLSLRDLPRLYLGFELLLDLYSEPPIAEASATKQAAARAEV